MGSHQEELKYAHLGDRDSPARKANREALREHIEEIQAEQVEKNAALRARVATFSDTRLRVASRYADGRKKRRESV
jgi:hypothetical protein